MSTKDQQLHLDPVWTQICRANDVDPKTRMAARLEILTSADAQDCTVYRPDETDPDAEELDLGDAKVLFLGQFEPPAEWDAAERADFYADSAPELFMNALLECEAKPASAEYFTPEVGDYVATMPGLGEVVMYYVCDYSEDERGRLCVLLRDDEILE